MEEGASMACWMDVSPVGLNTQPILTGVSPSHAQEAEGVDGRCSSWNGPSEGAADVLKEEPWRDLVSFEYDDRVRKVGTTWRITRHQRLFRLGGGSAYL